MRTGSRLLAAATLTAVAGTALAVPAAAAACEDGGGVTVVVDFASLGGGTRTGCAPGDPSSGVAALRGAGHEPTRAAQQPGYFVCRIDGKPASDPCQRASPADAYWSYWHAKPGGTWTFSNTGAADYDPEPGSVEGWAFGDGKPPSTPPPSARQAPAPEPSRTPAAQQPAPPPAAPQQAPQAQPAPARPTSASSQATQSPSAGAPLPPSPVGAVAQSPSPTPTAPSASPSAAPTATSSPVVSLPAEEDDGSLLGPLLAALVVGLLVAAGARQVRLRRTGRS